MHVLLVNPPSMGIFKLLGLDLPPLGLLYVAAYLEQAGVEVTLLDLNTFRKGDPPLSFRSYDIVGIGTDTTRYFQAQEIAKKAKAEGSTVVMGGPHPFYAAEEILKTGVVDYIVRGEGEETLLDIVHALEQGKSARFIPGVSSWQQGKLLEIPPRPFLEDLDSLPFPARHLLPMDRYPARMGYRRITSMHTSRGCPAKCSFCSSSYNDGFRVRARSAKSIVDEIQAIQSQYDFGAVAFMDDLFTLNPNRVRKVCQEILKRKVDVHWWCFSRADTLKKNEDLVALMAESGCKTIFVGVEAGDNRTLKAYNKGSKLQTSIDAVDLLKKYQIQIIASYILGGPQESIQQMFRTLRFAQKLDTTAAQFTLLTPFPGTQLYQEVEPLIYHKDWSKYDSLHVLFKRKSVGEPFLHIMIALSYFLFYFRSFRSLQNFGRFLKLRKFSTLPALTKLLLQKGLSVVLHFREKKTVFYTC
jgi:anaerobic magnesium-protoporphyrin IX monomethyl ester cyclase